MRVAWGLAAVLVMSVAVFSDTVETTDGRVFEGTEISGLANEFKVDDDGVEILIQQDWIATLEFTEGEAAGRTTTGVPFAGKTASRTGTLVLMTETGAVSFPMATVARIICEHEPVDAVPGAVQFHLADGRVLDGDLPRAFPDPISISQEGVVVGTNLEAVTAVEFGTPTVVHTQRGATSGVLDSTIPRTMRVETEFGVYKIPSDTVVRLEIVPPDASPTIAAEETTSGPRVAVGAMLWHTRPFAVAGLQWAQWGAEVSVGFGPVDLSGGDLGDDSVLWLGGHATYHPELSFSGVTVAPAVSVGLVGGVHGLGLDLGADALVRVSLLDTPIDLMAGVNWTYFSGMSVWGLHVEIRLGIEF